MTNNPFRKIKTGTNRLKIAKIAILFGDTKGSK
jgi:hypothetical protein